MTIKKILRPGDPGTKKTVEKFGDRLVCIRYRYDQQKQIRYKTAEIILEEKSWKLNEQRIPANKLLKIRIGKFETTIRALVKSYGGKYDLKTGYYLLPYSTIKKLDLMQRIIK